MESRRCVCVLQCASLPVPISPSRVCVCAAAFQSGRLSPASTSVPTCRYYQYFWGAANSTMPTVTASVTVNVGGVNLFATNLYDGTNATLPNAFTAANNNCMPSLGRAGNLVLNPNNISSSCLNAANPVWVVGVCTPMSQLYSTSYTIVFTHASSPIMLLDGRPLTNQNVAINATQVYFIPINDFTRDIYVVVTTISGDADVVASFVPNGALGANASSSPYCLLQNM